MAWARHGKIMGAAPMVVVSDVWTKTRGRTISAKSRGTSDLSSMWTAGSREARLSTKSDESGNEGPKYLSRTRKRKTRSTRGTEARVRILTYMEDDGEKIF